MNPGRVDSLCERCAVFGVSDSRVDAMRLIDPDSRHASVMSGSYDGAGPRLEIRLRDQFFRGNGLEQGRTWNPDIADSIFREKLARLQLPRIVNAIYARKVARQIMFMDRDDILNLFVVTNLPLPASALQTASIDDDVPF